MFTRRSRRPRSDRDPHRRVAEKQLHRWLDDGGAVLSDPEESTAPVMWSPAALKARLDARHEIQRLQRRARGASAEARVRISRIIAEVEARRLTQAEAIDQLRELTLWLRGQQAVERARHQPPDWVLLLQRTAVGR